MGKLFDRLDCAWEIAQTDKAEQDAGRTEKLPTDPPDWQPLTGFQLTSLDGNRHTPRGGKEIGRRSEWEKLRTRSRMKLLRTGTLMRDLRFAMSLFRACPRCAEVDGKRRACQVHKSIVRKAIMAVKYAGEDNMSTRLAQGRVWGDDDAPTERREGNLNEWESWYFQDKREGVWPGTVAYTGTARDVAKLKEEYGSLDYRGWLAMLFDNEEISYGDYAAEKARLSDAANCA